MDQITYCWNILNARWSWQCRHGCAWWNCLMTDNTKSSDHLLELLWDVILMVSLCSSCQFNVRRQQLKLSNVLWNLSGTMMITTCCWHQNQLLKLTVNCCGIILIKCTQLDLFKLNISSKIKPNLLEVRFGINSRSVTMAMLQAYKHGFWTIKC